MRVFFNLVLKYLTYINNRLITVYKRPVNVSLLFAISLLLFIVTGALLFDCKIFLMGDDADYILDAFKFTHENVFPASRASLYAISLGLPVYIWGTNVIVLKLFSFVCAVAGFCIFYMAWRKRVPYPLLFFVLLFMAICSGLQYYSSSNLSEAFFMMIQAIYFLFIFRLLQQTEDAKGRTALYYWGAAGLCGLLISLSKNIAFAAPFVLPVFYLAYGQIKNSILAVLSFLAFKIPFELLLRLKYGKNTMIGQLRQVIAKDLYHTERGAESISGFFLRFWNNGKIYLSGNMPGFLGFGKEEDFSKHIMGWIVIAVLCSYGLYKSYRDNRYIFFAGLYLFIMTSCTFLALQPDVAQSRIIIIFVPYMCCLLFYSLYKLLDAFKYTRPLRFVVPVLAGLVCITVNMVRSSNKIVRNVPVLKHNLQGDTFYGYTPDWINYLKMGREVAARIPDTMLVAARKPNCLTVYTGGRPFYGVYNVPDTATADGLLQALKANHVHYLMLASLREYPDEETGDIITTMHDLRDVIAKKYPDRIKTLWKTGATEPCYLVEVCW